MYIHVCVGGSQGLSLHVVVYELSGGWLPGFARRHADATQHFAAEEVAIRE